LDKNTFLILKLTVAKFQALATGMLTTSGGVEKPSLSTPALPI
jgi:hypothetical protein